MSLEDELVTIASAAYVIIAEEENQWKRRRPRRWWMMFLFKSWRKYSGTCLMHDLKQEIEYGLFENFCRMKSSDFEYLLNSIGPRIWKPILKSKIVSSNLRQVYRKYADSIRTCSAFVRNFFWRSLIYHLPNK